MTTLTVRHVSTYRYRRPVMLGEHRMMFRPRDSYDQRLIDSRLNITPRPASLRWMHDVFGNCVAVAAFNASTDMLRFESTIRVAHYPSHAPDFQIDPPAKTYPFFYDPDELPDLAPSIRPAYSDSQDEVGRWARGFLSPGESTPKGKLLMTMTCAIREGFSYARRLEKGIQSPAKTLLLRRGTCRDFALLMMEAVRALGFAARFISGYIYVPSRGDERHLGGGSTHAWCQVYLPGAGWIEFDPTNGIIGNRDLIRVAVARGPEQAIPLCGTYVGVPDDDLGLRVEVSVQEESHLPQRGVQMAG